MYKKIGIIGCQSKHAEFFGSLFNIDKIFPGYSAAFLLGDDDPQRLPYVQDKAQIPTICSSAHELIELSDGVLITYRMSEQHFDPAMLCIQKGKPLFIDKPFTLSLDKALSIAEASIAYQVPVLGGSTLCFDPQLETLVEISQTSTFGTITYRADPESPFGGYRFYGSHLTDLCSMIFGTQALSADSTRFGDAVCTVVKYPNRSVILHSQPDLEKPQVIYSTQDSLSYTTLDDKSCYRNGMQVFIKMVETGTPAPRKLDQLIFSVNLLDAIMRSLASGKEIELTMSKERAG